MNNKRTAYIIATVILMLGVSFIAHVWIATYRLGYFHPVPTNNYRHLLPPRARVSVLVFGIVVGILVGIARWDIVYVQKRHWTRKK